MTKPQFPTSDIAVAVGVILECPIDVAEDHVRRYPEDSERLVAHFPEIYAKSPETALTVRPGSPVASQAPDES